MTRKYFGTDGIRGRVNGEKMNAETALRLGMAAGTYFRRGEHRHRVVIGKDTRLSGYMIEPALVAGFTSMGMDVFLFGPIPTPAVAFLARSLRADLGVMISASHNAFEDNGIKLFGPDGYKLSDAIEQKIEQLMDAPADDLVPSAELGRAKRIDDSQARYIEFAKRTFPKDLTLEGIKLVIDCANGAAYKVAPTALWELGAEVISMGVSPNGVNINKGCGSTDTAALADRVRETRADIGIALDGDADRLIICDENGTMIDGDQIMGLVARDWQSRDLLSAPGIVTTVMSNLGLERHLQDNGLSMARTQVGDRYVVEHMRQHGFNLGGEQSGHMVMSDFSTTGDGLIAALQVLAVMKKTDKPVSDLCRVFTPVPQILENVRFSTGAPLEHDDVKAIIAACEVKLGNQGRLLIRKSGTEPLIRVMAEGDDAALVQQLVSEIVDTIQTVAA
ncbi:MAG: phosphoglucosamine mutase [Rhodobiaceae bacterium]|jgi:phosphoglucosamine mutase|nr:phosphoglucosamine mutase [Rhodobiaceae bacterium]